MGGRVTKFDPGGRGKIGNLHEGKAGEGPFKQKEGVPKRNPWVDNYLKRP